MPKRIRRPSPQHQGNKIGRSDSPIPNGVSVAAERRTQAQQFVVDSALKGEQPQLCKLLTEPGWLEILGSEMEKDYFRNLENSFMMSGRIQTPPYIPRQKTYSELLNALLMIGIVHSCL